MYFLILISTVLMLFLTDMPPKIASMSDVFLLPYHFLIIFLSKKLIGHELRKYPLSIRNRFFIYFLAGYTISLALALFFWIPTLIEDYDPRTWGAFDPIKYYAMAHEMIKSGIGAGDTENFPVVYIFYYELLIWGANPLIPFFINTILYLYAVLILAKFLNPNNSVEIRNYVWLMLIPEVLYFNITSSKDIICLICSSILFVHFQRVYEKKLKISGILIMTITFGILFVARTSMALMSIVCILIFYIDIRKLNKTKLFFLIVGIFATVAFMHVNQFIGQPERENLGGLTDTVAQEVGGDMAGAIKMEDPGALASALIPTNTFEFFVFGIIRSIVTAMITVSDVVDFKLFTHINMTVQITSYLMTISWPLIFYMALRGRTFHNKEFERLFIVMIIYVLAVGMSTPLFIHRRYRLVYDLFFFAIIIKSIILIKNRRALKNIVKHEG